MIESMKRMLRLYPAAKLAFLLAGVILIFHEWNTVFPWDPLWSYTAAVLSASAAYLLMKFQVFSMTAWILSLILLTGGRMSEDQPGKDHISLYLDTGKETAVTGYVCSDPVRSGSGKRFFLETDSLYFTRHIGFPVNGKILIRTGPDIGVVPGYGDGLKLYGTVGAPPGERNPGDFNYAAYLKNRGAHGILQVTHKDKMEKTGEWRGQALYAGWVLPVKHYVLDYFRKAHSPQASSILSALILGDRSEVPEEVYEAFSKSGTVHVLALSGLHVGFVMALLWGLLGFLRIPFRYRVILTIGALWFYAAIADFAPSVVRAVLMASVVMFGEMIQRRRMLINNLLVAMILILIADPASLFDVGFQLSFTAVFSIVWMYPKLESWCLRAGMLKEHGNPVLNKTVMLMLLSAAAQIGTLPFTAYYFYRIPLLATAANVFVVPLSGVVLMLGFFEAALSPISMTFSLWYANLNEWLIALLTAVPEWSTGLPLAYTDYYGMSLLLLVFYYAFLIWVSLWKYRAIRMAGIFGIFIGLNILTWGPALYPEDEVTVSMLDVGQGDCAVIRTPDDRVVVIDAGDRSETFDYGERVIAPYLRKQGIDRIHYLIMTHPHDDHIGGMPYLIRHFHIDTAYHNGHPVRSDTFDEVRGILAEKRIPLRSLCAGDLILTPDGIRMLILSPGRELVLDTSYAAVNDGSLVIGMRYGTRQFLFMGDCERNMFGHFNKYAYFMKSDVIKVSHHGASNGTTQELISLVQPGVSVVSVGKYNRFNHPSPRALQAYRECGSDVVRTDENGAVIFRTNGQNLNRIR